MKAEITYTEAEQLISKYAHKEVKIDFIDEKTIRVSLSEYSQDNPEPTGFLERIKNDLKQIGNDILNCVKRTVAIDLHVVSINGNDIILQYNSDIQHMPNYLNSYIDTRIEKRLEDYPSDIYTLTVDNQIAIHLDHIDPLKSTLNILTPSDLSFTSTIILISTILKVNEKDS